MRPLARVVLFGLVPACAHAALRTERSTATLRVRCNVPTASIYVDEVLLGRAAELGDKGTPLLPGRHRVECRSDGFYSAYREVDPGLGQTTALDVFLHPMPEGEPSESP